MSSESNDHWGDHNDREPVDQNVDTQQSSFDVDEEIRLVMERLRSMHFENDTGIGEPTFVPNTVAEQTTSLTRASGDSEPEILRDSFSMLSVLSNGTEDVTPVASSASGEITSDQATSSNGTDGNGDNVDPISRKNYMIRKLVSFVESVDEQHEFCDYLNLKIVDYFLAKNRYLTPKPIDKNEKPECLQRRFASAVAYLNNLISSDESAFNILQDCYEKFHDSRDDPFDTASSAYAKTLAVLESLLAEERNFFVCNELRFEIKTLNEIRARLKTVQSELMNNAYKTTSYYTGMLTSIQILLTKLDKYEPHLTNDSAIRRVNVLTKIKDTINNDIISLQSQVECLRIEREQNEIRELDKAYGHFVEIRIVPSPREQREQMLRTQSESQYQAQLQSESPNQFQSPRRPQPHGNANSRTSYYL